MTGLGDGPTQRPHGRAADALRPLQLTTGELKFAEGSALICLGDTRVLAAASVDTRVPPFLAGPRSSRPGYRLQPRRFNRGNESPRGQLV